MLADDSHAAVTRRQDHAFQLLTFNGDPFRHELLGHGQNDDRPFAAVEYQMHGTILLEA